MMDEREKMPEGVTLTMETAGIPEWIRLLPRGLVSLGDGRQGFEVDQEAIESMVRHFQARGLDLVIDYEHQTLEGGQAPAAGWIKALEGRPDGLWARVEWTAKGKDYLQNREYRYFSPVLAIDQETHRPVALLQVALTNTPAINHLPPLVAKDSLVVRRTPGEKGDMVTAGKDDEQMGERGKAVGHDKIPETETGEAVIQSLSREEMLEALGLPAGASRSETLATIAALKSGTASLTSLQKMVAKLKAALAERDTGKLVELALKTGKVTPAQREWALEYARRDPEGFQVFLAKAPKIVPVGERLELARETESRPYLSPGQAEINRLMGISEEVYLKYNSEGRE